jgi:uncharacterized damage-inducible protein DinB
MALLRARGYTRRMDDAELVAYVSRVHGRTREAAERLTDALVGWRLRPGEFTAGELVMHIANTRRMNLMRLGGLPHFYQGHAIAPETTTVDLLEALDSSAEDVATHLAEMDLDQPLAIAPMGSGFGWQVVLGGLVEHEVHHRSQLCDYLSAAGIDPPALYGLHVEDLPRG